MTNEAQAPKLSKGTRVIVKATGEKATVHRMVGLEVKVWLLDGGWMTIHHNALAIDTEA